MNPREVLTANFSAANLLGSLVFSSVGFFGLTIGKKHSNFPRIAVGILLIGYSYFISSTLLLYLIGAGLIAALIALKD